MTNERVSPASRIRGQIVAERELKRYAGDHSKWHKHVHNADLDPVQLLKMEEMDREPQTIDFSCRRTRKTTTKEMHCLEYLACNADQEEGIVAPREAQAQVNLRVHLDAIRRSPILDAYLMYDRGRKQFSETRYQFANRSVAQSYGIMAQVDGGSLTLASLEEVDDMPADRLYANFLLMMGATQRLGAARSSVNKPCIRVTGVYKGAPTLAGMLESGQFHKLPIVDIYLAIEMGIFNEQYMMQMREQLPAEEYLRQLMCINITARNLIWESWVQDAVQLGVRTNLAPVEPVPGAQYRKRGKISFGYDHLGHGEDPNASVSALVVLEEIWKFEVPIYVRKWKAGEDETTIKNDLKSLWRYFRPDYAMGDAYGIGLLTALNDDLYSEGLSTVDRRNVGDGSSTQSTWKDWAFAPLRFDGPAKHQMAQMVRASFKNSRVAMPYIDDQPEDEQIVIDQRLLRRQLVNMAAEATTKAYASYVRVSRKIGDDFFDAYCAASHALNTCGTGEYATFIATRGQTIEQLLGQSVPLVEHGDIAAARAA